MIDRIDFEVGSDGRVTVTKLQGNSPVGTEVKPAGFALAAALDWCRENGFTVHNWGFGARAWLGQPRPVRTPREAARLRREYDQKWSQEFHRNPGKWSRYDTLLSLDLQFDG